MKIAVWHNLPSGGGKRALYDQIAGLVARGHQVEAWAPPTIDRTYLPLTDLVRENIVPLDEPWPNRRDRWGISLYAERRIQAMDAHCRQCAAEIAQGDFDILFANACQFYRTTSIGRFSSLPSALSLPEPYRWLYEAMPDNPWAAPAKPASISLKTLKRGFADWREIRNARVQVREEITNAKAFDKILCNSFFSRESIWRSYGLPSDVCYVGIDVDHFKLSTAPRADHIVGLGAFTREKNVEICVRAIGAMPSPRPTLVWIGNVADQAYLDRVKALAVELNVILDARMRVTDEELLEVLGTARAMIYAPRLEPFGLAPVEAGACGTPVVAVAEAGVRETVADEVNGLLVNESPEELAAALVRLEREPDLARKLGLNGRKRAETLWSKEAATDRLITALETCINPKA